MMMMYEWKEEMKGKRQGGIYVITFYANHKRMKKKKSLS